MTQCNVLNPTRRSPQYEFRLAKYATRGYEVFVKDLDSSRINTQILQSKIKGRGLPNPSTNIPILTQRQRLEDWLDYSSLRICLHMNYWYRIIMSILAIVPSLFRLGLEFPHTKQQPCSISKRTFGNSKEYTGIQVSGLPRLLAPLALIIKYIAFIGDISDIMRNFCCQCPTEECSQCPTEEESRHFVHGSVQFLQDNPGRQQIGSFHPLDFSDYLCTAYNI